MQQQLLNITPQVSNVQTLCECMQNGFVALRAQTSVPVEFISNRHCRTKEVWKLSITVPNRNVLQDRLASSSLLPPRVSPRTLTH